MSSNILLYKKYTATWYQEKLLELLEMSPTETSYQDFIVYPLLDAIISSGTIIECELVDSKNFLQYNSSSHDRRSYSILTKAVPDLLIAKDFFYKNRLNDAQTYQKIISTVEVKEPNSSDMKSINKIKDHLILEIFPCLYKNNKVIITNIKSWIFLEKNISNLQPQILGNLEKYISIQEQCGFDNISECENKNKGKRGRASYVVTKDALTTHWKNLCDIINNLEESTRKDFIKNLNYNNNIFEDDNKLSSESSILSKEVFDQISKASDKVFINEIRNSFYNSYYGEKPIITLIDSTQDLIVNRLNSDSKDNELTCISDFNFSYDNWDELITMISEFIGINQK